MQHMKEAARALCTLTLTTFSPVPTVLPAVDIKSRGEEGEGGGAPCTKDSSQLKMESLKCGQRKSFNRFLLFLLIQETENARLAEEDSIMNTMHNPNLMYICLMRCTNLTPWELFYLNIYSLPPNFMRKQQNLKSYFFPFCSFPWR